MLELDEILIYGPPGGVFQIAEHPHAAALVVTVAGGHGGAAYDGTPGRPGKSVTKVFEAHELPHLPASMRVMLGRGGRNARGGRAPDGYCIIETYRNVPPNGGITYQRSYL